MYFLYFHSFAPQKKTQEREDHQLLLPERLSPFFSSGGDIIKSNIFIEIFEVCELPQWTVTVFFVRLPSYLGCDYSLDGVTPPWWGAGLAKKG